MEILTTCFIGLGFIFLGFLLRFYPPENINNSLGYKTPFARKNKYTWQEGNRFCGSILLLVGIIFIPSSILIRHLYFNNSNLSRTISMLYLLFLLLATIVFTEMHLRKIFDKNGMKKVGDGNHGEK